MLYIVLVFVCMDSHERGYYSVSSGDDNDDMLEYFQVNADFPCRILWSVNEFSLC